MWCHLRLGKSFPLADNDSRNKRGNALYQIPGMTPSLLNLPAGCAFRERCPRADTACLVAPEISSPLPGRLIRCFHPLHSEAS